MIRRAATLFSFATLAALAAVLLLPFGREMIAPPRDIVEIRNRQIPRLQTALAESGLSLGAPVFIRLFKEEAELELWVEDEAEFRLFRTYPICNYSGALGPKLREGDRQSPEGIYQVGLGALNPRSSYHLSFNLGFPNPYDRQKGRTGSYLMVHGDCLSIGCYAMTDLVIEEIYVIAEAALNSGQASFSVHAFPFRMTTERMQQAAGHRWIAFWQELRPIYQAFEDNRQVPVVRLIDGNYAI